MSERLIDKISALLAKAESSEFEAERDAFIRKAQELATSNAINLEVARQRQKDKTKREIPIQKHIKLFGWDDKSQTRPLYVLLWNSIAAHNDVMLNLFSDHSGVIAFGFPSDIEVVEAMYASLSVQMTAEMAAFTKARSWEGETYVDYSGRNYYGRTKNVSPQMARKSFAEGFRMAIGKRLFEARQAAEAVEVETVDIEALEAAPCDDSAPLIRVAGDIVLKGKREEVREFYKSESRARGSYRGGRSTGRSSAGYGAGRAAGTRANLGGSARGIGA